MAGEETREFRRFTVAGNKCSRAGLTTPHSTALTLPGSAALSPPHCPPIGKDHKGAHPCKGAPKENQRSTKRAPKEHYPATTE